MDRGRPANGYLYYPPVMWLPFSRWHIGRCDIPGAILIQLWRLWIAIDVPWLRARNTGENHG